MTKLGIIIVNFNTKEILVNCLNNLRTVAPQNTEIVVVDNGSKDGSPELVGNDFKDVKLVASANNGLSAGYNLGMTKIPDADYFLFLGADAFPLPGCLNGAVNYLENRPDLGIATVKLVLRNGDLDADAHRGFPTPWASFSHFSGLDRLFPKSKIFNKYFMGWCDMEKPHEIDLCISHFMLVRKEVFAKVGRWDEDFFVYGEDVDFCWRTKRSGFKIFYLPQYECLHYKGAGVGIRKESADVSKADDATKSRMKKETTRAMRLFYQKHMYKKYPWIINKLVELGIYSMSAIRK